MAPFKSLNTIVLQWPEGFQGAVNWVPMMPDKKYLGQLYIWSLLFFLSDTSIKIDKYDKKHKKDTRREIDFWTMLRYTKFGLYSHLSYLLWSLYILLTILSHALKKCSRGCLEKTAPTIRKKQEYIVAFFYIVEGL